MFSPSLRSLLQDIECEDGFTKRKVMMHAGNNFKFQELSDFNEIKCKAAYKVSDWVFYLWDKWNFSRILLTAPSCSSPAPGSTFPATQRTSPWTSRSGAGTGRGGAEAAHLNWSLFTPLQGTAATILPAWWLESISGCFSRRIWDTHPSTLTAVFHALQSKWQLDNTNTLLTILFIIGYIYRPY